MAEREDPPRRPSISDPVGRPSTIAAETPWYDLFSRGARDWLRHNEKVRDAVRESLPELLANTDVISKPSGSTLQVPVKLLEHSRFRLRDPEQQEGVGQGQGQPGDVLRQARSRQPASGSGGNEDGGVKFVLELKVEDLVDWLWEELKLPELKPKQSSSMDDPEYTREGWDKRGARSRLDRRRTVKEAVKRRAIQTDPVPFSNEDLRFRQLVRRARPATNAVVLFALDVSGSMGETQRKLAKTFFFFALQGIRRQYSKVECVFLAHAVEAWEFSEEQFFQVAGTGGTISSSVFGLANQVLEQRFDASQYNSYLFYASDGENASEDHDPALETGTELFSRVNYAGYAEIAPSALRPEHTQLMELFGEFKARGLPVAAAPVSRQEDVFEAIRKFFTDQAEISS